MTLVAQRNGQKATAADLAPLAFAGYAHFTAMQVRGGKVRGLDLHLDRLRRASMELFGVALTDEHIRTCIRAAIPTPSADLSLSATVYSPAGEFVVAGPDAAPEVLVRTDAPSSGPRGPLRLAVFEHERALAHIKHVGEVAKTYFLRQAAERGFNDAAFMDREGRLSEASIWNLAFWDGEAVVWPEAAMLQGTTMAIVQRQLEHLGVPQRSLIVTPDHVAAMSGAVVMNSWTPGIAVTQVGSVVLPAAPAFVERLHQAYAREPLVSL